MPLDAIPHTTLVPSHPNHRLGLHLPPDRKPVLPHFTDLKARYGIETALCTFDYLSDFPAQSGALGNDRVGNCAFAGIYHRLQVVTWALFRIFLTPDQLQPLAYAFYETFGYDPSQTDAQGNNPTDTGGNMDQIAEFLINGGLELVDGTRDKFLAAFEVDPQNDADLSFCGKECLGIGFGVVVTDTVMPADGSAPPTVWTSRPGEKQLGGHFTFQGSRTVAGDWGFISWGLKYLSDPSFNTNRVQAVAYVSADALKNGQTVCGLNEQQWLAEMAGRGRPIAS